MVSIENFSVPTGENGRGGMLQPLQQHMFRVNSAGFAGLKSADCLTLTQQVVRVTQPSLVIPVDSEDPSWRPIIVVFRYDVSNLVASRFSVISSTFLSK